MTETTLLQQILEANKSFLAGAPRQLDSSGKAFLVITCIDPRLSAFLEPALGLPRHRAAVIRVAGNLITSDVLRSVATALYLLEVGEIIVVGHSDCGLADLPIALVAENIRKAGVRPPAIDDQDLRQWFGAFTSERVNVLSGIDTLRASGLVPPWIKIHGLIFNIELGALDVLVDGNLPSNDSAITIEPTTGPLRH